MIITKTPYRISFFGGGTDLSEWLDQENDGLVLSTSINKYCYVTIRDLPKIFDYKYSLRYYKNEYTDDIKDIKHNSIRSCLEYLKFHDEPIELVHHGELPSRSGLGSSSTFTVGLLNALYKINNYRINKKKLAQDAIYIEQKVLNESVGIQDHIAASFGGFNIISMKKNNRFNLSVIKKKDLIKKIEANLILIFTGLHRNSEPLEKIKLAKIKKGDSHQHFNNILDITKEAIIETKSDNFSIKNFGKLLSQNWHHKKLIHKSITNNKIDEIYDKVMGLGAYGGKLLGSGNGGFLLFLCPSNKVKKIEEIFKNRVLKDIKFETKGSHVIYP